MSKARHPAEQVTQMSIERLIPYARNSRTHSDAQVAQIAASIKEWGWTTPVLIDEGGQIIAGHGRIMAARKLGMAEVPVIIAEGWTEAQKKAYVIADNKLALNAGWDEEILKLEFDELKELGFDLEMTGFSLDELDVLNAPPGESSLDDEKYTAKITTPIYEIKGKKPLIGDLYDAKKAHLLISEINKTDLPSDLKDFLTNAAKRHVAFNYENIAEFYAHSDEPIRKLMRDSALVIIDYDSAIENGYVKLSKTLMELSAENEEL
jgi:hypothetical protein